MTMLLSEHRTRRPVTANLPSGIKSGLLMFLVGSIGVSVIASLFGVL